jgi:alpha-tubulin suppressor-like RCC1 family protein
MGARTWLSILAVLVINAACDVSGHGKGHAQLGDPAVAVAIAAGAQHSLALMSDGSVWTWGRNLEGQLGDGGTTDRTVPVPVAALPEARAIAAGNDHTLAADATGAVWQWGRMSHDQLGAVTDAPAGALALTPEPVAGLPVVTMLAAGGTLGPGGFGHALALDGDGRVWAWGHGTRGQLGQAGTGSLVTPAQVHDLAGAVAIAAGGFTSLATLADGSLWSWGSNAGGQLGDGTTERRALPTRVAGLDAVVAVAAGGDGDRVHVLAVDRSGAVWAWGDDASNSTADGVVAIVTSPTPVIGVEGAVAAAAGDGFSLVLDADGRVWSWGENHRGQLGDDTTQARARPAPIDGLSHVVAVAAGGSHALAIDAEGRVWAWGAGERGQLGDGETEDRATPHRIDF